MIWKAYSGKILTVAGQSSISKLRRNTGYASALLLLLLMILTGCTNSGRAWLQRKLIYFPEHRLAWNPSSLGLPFEDVRFRTEDAVKLHGWFIPRTNSA